MIFFFFFFFFFLSHSSFSLAFRFPLSETAVSLETLENATVSAAIFCVPGSVYQLRHEQGWHVWQRCQIRHKLLFFLRFSGKVCNGMPTEELRIKAVKALA